MSVRSEAASPLRPDDRAFVETLVRDLGPRVLAYVHRVCGDRQAAEDIVAETFCRAVENLSAVRTGGRHDLYVLTIARNLCRDRFRRRRSSESAEWLDERMASGETPEDAAVLQEQRETVRAAVDELPEPLREVVVLRMSVGLRFEEIAELLHIPLGTALSRMHAALQRLRSALGVER